MINDVTQASDTSLAADDKAAEAEAIRRCETEFTKERQHVSWLQTFAEVFLAGTAYARSKSQAKLEDLHTHEKDQLMKWRHRRDNGQLREDEWRGYDTGWADALTFALSKLKKNAT